MEGNKKSPYVSDFISSRAFLTDFYACNLPQKFVQQTERKSVLCIPGKTLLAVLRSDGVFSQEKMRAAACY